MVDLMRAHEATLGEPRLDRTVTFADAAARWLHHIEHVEGCKPSTLDDYRYMLAPAETLPRKRGSTPAARIMRAFGHRPLASIATSDVARFLARLDLEPTIGPRTVNKHRQVLCSVFEHAMRADTFRLPVNPARRPTSAASPTRHRSTSTSPRRCSRSRVGRTRGPAPRSTAARDLARGERRARAHERAGRRALRRRRLRRPAPRRAARAALAQRGLRRRQAHRRGELVRGRLSSPKSRK